MVVRDPAALNGDEEQAFAPGAGQVVEHAAHGWAVAGLLESLLEAGGLGREDIVQEGGEIGELLGRERWARAVERAACSSARRGRLRRR